VCIGDADAVLGYGDVIEQAERGEFDWHFSRLVHCALPSPLRVILGVC